MRIGFALPALAMLALCCGPADASAPIPAASVAHDALAGAWQAERYRLKDGSDYPILGQILFAGGRFTVLYIVVKDGVPQRGNGEGGSYSVVGNTVTFVHHYMVSTPADAIPGLTVQDLRHLEWPAEKNTTEHSTFTVVGDTMTLLMPSGSRLTWRRAR